MSKSLGIILNYIQNNIQSLQDEIKDLNVFISNLEEYSDLIAKMDKKIFQMPDFFDEFKIVQEEYVEAFSLVQEFGNSSFQDEIQIKESKEYLKTIEDKLKELLTDKKRELATKSEKYIRLKKKYFEYLNIFDEYGLRLDINWKEISEFIDFLYSINVDLEIVEDFEKYCLNNYKSVDSDESVINNSSLDVIEEKTKEQILSYIKNYDELSQTDKKMIISIRKLIASGIISSLKRINSRMSNNEILYFSEILNLKELYSDYLSKTQISYSEIKDEESQMAYRNDLQNIVVRMNTSLKQIDLYLQLISEEEKEVYELLQSNNLLLFLSIIDDDQEDISVSKFDIDYIKNNYNGDEKDILAKTLHLINNQLRIMNNDELTNLGYNHNKPLILNAEKINPSFDSLDIRICKGMITTAVQIAYLSIPISDSNQIELEKEYDLGSRPFVYLILGLFDKENEETIIDTIYLRLQNEESQIIKIMDIFSRDFTLETKEEAFSLINASKRCLDIISQQYFEEGVIVK